MNRRFRAVHHRPSPRRPEGGFHRYLKPGALAQLRDSRISARSHRLHLHSQISLYYRSPSSSPLPTTLNNTEQLQVNLIGAFPGFTGTIYGPRCPQRKKIVSAKSVFFNPASHVVSDSPESIIDTFSSDILVL